MLTITYTHDAGSTIQEARAVADALVSLWGLEGIETNMINPDEVSTATMVITRPDPEPAAPNAAAIFGDAAHTPDPPRAPVVTGGDLDADGIPWDKRIHAETKSQTQKGLWQRRRNTDDAVFASVMAELKAAKGARVPVPANDNVAPAPVDAATVFGNMVAAANTGGDPAAVLSAASPPAPPAPPVAPAPGALDFPTLMKRVTAMQKDGKITLPMVGEINSGIGAPGPSIMEMFKNAALIGPFSAVLDMLDAGLDVPTAIASVMGA